MEALEAASAAGNLFLTRLRVDSEDGTEYIDVWHTGELLVLASSVLRSDRNWVSVARTVRSFVEETRPADFGIAKNCALQYSKLLNEVDQDPKNTTLPRTERETSEVMLVKTLTEKRKNELEWSNQQIKAAANITKLYLEMVDNGEFDDNIDELLDRLLEDENKLVFEHKEYLNKREKLNATKRLNKSRVHKGKGKAKAVDKRKMSSDKTDENANKRKVEEVIKNVKKEMATGESASALSNPVIVKKEKEEKPHITLNALLDSEVTTSSSEGPPSAHLTTLLFNLAASTATSHTISSVTSPLKEVKSVTSSQQFVQPSSMENSQRIDATLSPTKIPSSSVSPLLTSLLKSTSAPLIVQSSSMPVSFSKEPLPTERSHTIKTEDELSAKLRETPPKTSVLPPSYSIPVSSPLLNSLLKNTPSSQISLEKEMSPKVVSSPQPFFNPASALATAAAQQLAVATSTVTQNHQFFKQHEVPETKMNVLPSPATSVCLSAPTLSKLLEMPPSTPGRLPPLPVPDPPATTIPITAPFAVPETGLPVPKSPNVQGIEAQKKIVPQSPVKKTGHKEIPESPFPCDTSLLHKSLTSYSHANKRNIPTTNTADTKDTLIEEKALGKFKIEFDNPSIENMDALREVCESINQALEKRDATKDVSGEDKECKGLGSSKVAQPATISHRQKTISLKTEKVSNDLKISGCNVKDQPSTTQKEMKGKSNSEKSKCSQEFVSSSLPTTLEAESLKISDASLEIAQTNKLKDCKSPTSKKPDCSEKVSPEKVESKGEELSKSVRRSGRRGKRHRGRGARNTPVKQIEPKDQYEFTENTEESSDGSQASNTLCYMPRVKEDSQSEDSKERLASVQESNDALSNATLPATDKKTTPSRSKQEAANIQLSNAKKALFTSEKKSESKISDKSSGPQPTEGKLKLKEVHDKKDDLSKNSTAHNKSVPVTTESSKKKSSPPKKNILEGKERKIPAPDKEDPLTLPKVLEVLSPSKDVFEGKDSVPAASIEMEIDAMDTNSSSFPGTPSDKLDDVEGSESLHSSIAAEFSSPLMSEGKNDKEASQSAKADWIPVVSPKSSSEAVSLSSEESEESESDNWDNQSVSTNKSTSHSSGAQSRPKRKERETPEYKAWKKAISIVLREASCHKNANIFMQKVTNDVAPGYSSIVHRPMDLSLIKKNIDNGVIKTTDEFHRDMLLMFQNAIMYNNSDHDVHQMAAEMQRDVVQMISAFLTTQSNDKDEANEPVSSLRGARKSQKGLGKHASAGTPKQKEETD